jgi:Uma2 family endonuclease
MATQTSLSSPPAPLVQRLPAVPPLETGDVLDRDEFERRYEAMPDLKKAELIERVVFVGPPVGGLHARSDAHLAGWLAVYAAGTPGTESFANATVRLDQHNEVQPDALLRIAIGGQSRVEQYIEGPPELVVEVATSSVSRDLHSKLDLYRRFGVREYVVWRTMDQDLDWFVLDRGEFVRLSADERGLFRSQVFPGLWLDKTALLAGNMAAVLAMLGTGLASPEHGELVRQLAARG